MAASKVRTAKTDLGAGNQSTPVHHDESYGCDGLHRLTAVDRGNLTSGALTEGTHYYGQRFFYDTMGRWGASVQFVESGKYQVTAFLHDVWGRMTEVRSGVATVAPTGYSVLNVVPINTPTNFNGYATIATTEYDANGVGDDEVTRTKRFYGISSSNYVETIYKRTFRGTQAGAIHPAGTGPAGASSNSGFVSCQAAVSKPKGDGDRPQRFWIRSRHSANPHQR